MKIVKYTAMRFRAVLLAISFICTIGFYPIVYYNNFSVYPDLETTIVAAVGFTLLMAPLTLLVKTEEDKEEVSPKE